MAVTLKTIDQTPGAPVTKGPELSFKTGQVTVREIVCARVRTEVERYNKDPMPRSFAGLVNPPPEELELNAPRPLRPRELNAEAQIEVALDAVRRGRVIVLFNGEQVTDIDAPLVVTPVSEARFLKLVPLVGG
jgi:hypothetical protein